MKQRSYIAIDLKSFYASVECRERGLDPMNANLVVADSTRTEKTICLAVSPSLKSYGIPGRARLFEVIQRVKEVNRERLRLSGKIKFAGSSYFDAELKNNAGLALDYIVAPPRMSLYMNYSTKIYDIYLKYIAPEDIQVYSIDEVFMDVTDYLATYKKTPRELAMTIINDVFEATGITATAGIGTNLYLCKIAMDIIAKKCVPDKNGVRIAELDEMTYREQLWNHRPITDFWRVGNGYANRLASYGIHTMGDIARCSVGKSTDFYSEELLYKIFGINAELLIDHAWGWEPCTMKDIREYRPATNSISSGQVLKRPYSFDEARIVVREMADMMALDLVDKAMVTNQMVLVINYDVENVKNSGYEGEIITDHYGRKAPKYAHGTENLKRYSSSSKIITDAVTAIFEREVNPKLTVRRITLCANRIIDERNIPEESEPEMLDFFTDYDELEKKKAEEEAKLAQEKSVQKAILTMKKKYGKNAVVKGMNMEKAATAIERNGQIGGHKA